MSESFSKYRRFGETCRADDDFALVEIHAPIVAIVQRADDDSELLPSDHHVLWQLFHGVICRL